MDGEPPAQLVLDDFIFDTYAPRLFQVREIVALKTQGINTEVSLTNGKKSIFRRALTHIEPRLPSCFFQARRGHVINFLHVRDMASAGRRAVLVTLADLSDVMISRKQFIALGRQRGL